MPSQTKKFEIWVELDSKLEEQMVHRNDNKHAVQRSKPKSDWFGDRLKRLRLDRGLTLDELSRQSNISKSNLSRIENNKISPTYDAISQIAHGLEIETQDLFKTKAKTKLRGWRSITRAGHEKIIETPQYRLSLLCSDIISKSFMMFLAEVKARSVTEFSSLVSHLGEEQIYVVSGKIELHTELYEPCIISEGESIFFDSTMGHAIISVSEENAQIVWTCSNVVLPSDGETPPSENGSDGNAN